MDKVKHVTGLSDGKWPTEVVNGVVNYKQAHNVFRDRVNEHCNWYRRKDRFKEARCYISKVRKRARAELREGTMPVICPWVYVAAVVGVRWFKRNMRVVDRNKGILEVLPWTK